MKGFESCCKEVQVGRKGIEGKGHKRRGLRRRKRRIRRVRVWRSVEGREESDSWVMEQKGLEERGIRKRSKRREGEIRGDNGIKRRGMLVQEDRRIEGEKVRSVLGIKRRKHD